MIDAVPLRPLSSYVHELRPELPVGAFEPAPARAALIPIHLTVITAATIAIAAGWVPWPIALVLSIVIGLCFSNMTFVAHEAMHGAVVRRRTARVVIGWIGFLPFTLSPRLWAAWHGRVHHGATNSPGDDPDAYPLIEEYRTNSRVRFFIHWFALGGGRWRGLLSLVIGFTVQCAIVLVTARTRGMLSRRQHRLAMLETALGVAVWATVAVLVGPLAFVLAFVVPLVVANVVVMSYILTNHSLSPLASINDPLVTGLSVTNSKLVEWATLRFGYHVEHHLFPAMSSRHAPAVRELVRARWPGRYQSMPHVRALGLLHRTSRLYKDAITLIDPMTGREYPTLMPAPEPPVADVAPPLDRATEISDLSDGSRPAA